MVCKVQYQMNDVLYEREFLVRHAYQVLAVKLNAGYSETGLNKEEGLLGFCVNMNRKPFKEKTEMLYEHMGVAMDGPEKVVFDILQVSTWHAGEETYI